MKKGKKQTEHVERKKETHNELKSGRNMTKYCEGIQEILYIYPESN